MVVNPLFFCHGCGYTEDANMPISNLFDCESCELVKFCSSKCKQDDVNSHQPLCDFFQEVVNQFWQHNNETEWDEYADFIDYITEFDEGIERVFSFVVAYAEINQDYQAFKVAEKWLDFFIYNFLTEAEDRIINPDINQDDKEIWLDNVKNVQVQQLMIALHLGQPIQQRDFPHVPNLCLLIQHFLAVPEVSPPQSFKCFVQIAANAKTDSPLHALFFNRPPMKLIHDMVTFMEFKEILLNIELPLNEVSEVLELLQSLPGQVNLLEAVLVEIRGN